MSGQRLVRVIHQYGRFFLSIALPIALTPIPILVPNMMGYTAYVLLLVSIYWMTLLIPLGITGLLPIIFFPLLGIQSSNEVVSFYTSNIAYLVMGALFMSIAIEHHNLHTRIALCILIHIGFSPRRLLLGMMLATYFLSMFMSNIATVTIMIPIAEAVLEKMRPVDDDSHNDADHVESSLIEMSVTGKVVDLLEEDVVEIMDMVETPNDRPINKGANGEQMCGAEMENYHALLTNIIRRDQTLINRAEGGDIVFPLAVEGSRSTTDGGFVDSRSSSITGDYEHFCKGVLMSIPWSANMGGVAVFTGSAINPFFLSFVEGLFGPVGITFANWSFYALPTTAIVIMFLWVWVQWFHIGNCFRCSKGEPGGDGLDSSAVSRHVRNEYAKLGTVRYAECVVIVHLVILVLLWIFRDPGFMPGWSVLFEDGYVLDSCPSILIGLSMFLVPAEMPRWSTQDEEGEGDGESGRRKIPAILTWEVLHEKMYWEIIFLIGGIMSLSDAMSESGLSSWMAGWFTGLISLPPVVVVILIATTVSFTTEVLNNGATITIFVPIASELAVLHEVNPLYYALTAGFAASFSFMLPAASFTNFLAYSTGRFAIKDMVKTGVVCNIIGISVLVLAINTIGRWVYELDKYPDWAHNLQFDAAPNMTTETNFT